MHRVSITDVRKSAQICWKPADLFALTKDVNQRNPCFPWNMSMVIDPFLANAPIPHPLRTQQRVSKLSF